MIDSNAFIEILADLDVAPIPAANETMSHSSVSSYISEYPELSRGYIANATEFYNGNLRVDKTRPFVFANALTRSSNSFIAGIYTTLPYYPSSNTLGFREFMDFLNVIEFDVALYLFHVFYRKHHANPAFKQDLKAVLDSQIAADRYIFVENFYNLIRLFIINKVITSDNTDIMNAFMEELSNQ